MDIRIRQFHENDSLAFYEAVRQSVEHLSLWLPWCTSSYSIEEAEYWVESSKAAWESGLDYRFVIENTKTSEIIGSVSINQINKAHKVGNLGYWVKKSHLNKGICKTAAKLAMEYAFKELDLFRIEIHVLVDNIASNKVAENLGATYEGTFRNKLFFRDKPCSAKCYSVIPADYHL